MVFAEKLGLPEVLSVGGMTKLRLIPVLYSRFLSGSPWADHPSQLLPQCCEELKLMSTGFKAI